MRTTAPLNLGAKVQITIVYASSKMRATGRVVSVGEDGMGIALMRIEEDDQTVLDGWLNELRTA